jgi:hypothetical protein
MTKVEKVVQQLITERFEKVKDLDKAYEQVIQMLDTEIADLSDAAIALKGRLKEKGFNEAYIDARMKAFAVQFDWLDHMIVTARLLRHDKWPP